MLHDEKSESLRARSEFLRGAAVQRIHSAAPPRRKSRDRQLLSVLSLILMSSPRRAEPLIDDVTGESHRVKQTRRSNTISYSMASGDDEDDVDNDYVLQHIRVSA